MTALEDRNHPGSAVGGLVAGVSGSLLLDPLSTMADIVGENAMSMPLSGAGTPSPDVSLVPSSGVLGSGDGSVALPQGSAQAGGAGSGGSGSGHDNYSISSVVPATGVFGDGFGAGLTFDPNALFGVSGTGGSPTASQGGSANLSQAASGGGGGNDTPATGSASAGYRSAADESGGSGGTGGTGGGSGTGSGMPGGTNPGGTGGTGSPPPGGTGGTGSPPSGGTGSPPPGGGGMPGGGTGNPGYPGGPGGGPGGMPGGTGQTASPPYKIEVLNQSEDDAVVRGDTLTFSIVTDGSNGTADGATAFGLNGIQWDFDSAQAGHSPDPTATEATVDHQMARTGECVIRATFTDPYGEPRTLSISQSVAPQGVSLAHQDDIYTSENTLVSLLPRTTFNEPGTETTNPEWWISYNGHDEEMDWGLSLTSPTKSFVNAGTYTVRVAVADTNGATAEDTFQVVVSPPSPKVTAKVDDWINEGSEATFKLTPANSAIDNVQTLRKLANPEADPNSDLMSIYVDWTGQSLLEGPPLPDALDPFEQIQKEDLAFEADGTITFKHLYDDNLGTHFKAIPYHPVIRTEDETGLKSVLPPLTLLVYNVAPVGILKVGTQISTKASSGQDLWQLPANNEISFDQVSDPSSADFDTLQYYWKETDFTPTGPLVTLWVTPESSTALQDESAQYVHRIEAWVFDKNGGQSEHKEYDLIANSPTLSAVAPNSIYGTMLLDGQKPLTGDADDKPDNYSPYYYSARAIRTKANGVHTVRLDVDAAGKTLGPLKYFFQVTYTSQVDGRQIGQQVNSYQSSDSFTTRPVENNERVTVWMAAYVQGTPPPPLGWQMAVFEGVRVQTTGEQINELWGLARQLTSSFADKAGVLLSAMDRDGILAFARTFLGASRDALSAYVQKLGSGAGLEAIFQWLGVKAPSGPTDLSADSLIALVLDYANINWETLDRVIEPVIGAGNSLAIEGISKLYADYDRTKTSGLVKFLRELPDRAAAWAGSADPESQFLKSVADDLNSALNLNAVRKLIEDQIATSFTDAIPWITVEVMAKFLPGVGAVSALIGAMKFFSENRDELFGQSRLFLDALGEFAVGGDTLRSRLAGKIELALVAVTPLFLTFGARQFGLNNVKVAVRLRVDAAVWTLEDKLQGTIAGIAGKMGGGTTTGKQALPQGGPRRDSVIAKATLLTDIKGHPGEKYMLSEVQVTGTAKLKLEEVRTDGKPAKNWILSDKSFYTPGTWATSINTDGRKFIESTRLPVGTSKARPRPAVGGVAPPGSQPPGGSNPNRPTVVKSGDLQKPVLDKLDRIRAEIKQNSCKELGTGCFAAGTLLSTPTGLKAIESFVSGDAILSQDEYDPRSGIVTRWVEEVFRRYAPVLGVHLRRKGDRRPMVIRSTSEHPFYVSDEKYIGKWVAAGELQEGQWVLCDDGRWARVEEVADTGEWEVVYNMRVADSHTYFVGEEGRGYAVWVHNAYLENMNRTAFVATTEIVAVDRAARERYKLANDKNVAVFKLKLPSGDTEYWVAASTSADIFRIRVTETLSPGSNGLPRPEKTFSGLGQLPLTDLQPFYFRFKSESSRPVVSPHSEEKLMAALNQKAAQAPVGQKYTLQEVFSEYAPCSNATHDHKCAFRLYEWSKSACGTNIEISTSNVLFSELHPNAPTAADRDASPFVDPDGLLSGYVSKANGPTLHNYFQGQISRKIRVKETIPNADNNSDDLGKFYWGMLDQQKIKASYRWHEIGAVHFNP